MCKTRAIRSRIEAFIPPGAANFWCHVTEGAFMTFGGQLVGPQLFAVLVQALGGSSTTLGALASIGSLSFLAPLIFAPRVEAARRKKRLVMLLGLGQRLPNVLVLAALVLLAGKRPVLCLYAIGLSRLAGGLATSLLVAPWQDLIAETVPIQRVGRLFGFRHSIASVLRLASAAACGAVIAYFAFPLNYELVYLFSFAMMMVSWGVFSLVDEMPEGVVPRARQAPIAYFRDLLAVLRRDRSYRYYLLYQGIGKSAAPVILFFGYAAVEHHRMKPGEAVALAGAATSLAMIGGNLLLPFLTERIGLKRMLGVSVCLRTAGMIVAALAPTGHWLIAGLFVHGLGGAGQMVAGPPFMMRVFPRGRRVGYITISAVALAPLGTIVPLLAGAGSQAFGFPATFAAAGVVLLGSLVPLRRVVLPPADGPTEGQDEPNDRYSEGR